MSSIIEQLNQNAPPSVVTLGGNIESFDQESGVIEFRFEASDAMTHSGGIVQGGFVAGMLDAAMAHVVFCVLDKLVILATLEMKVSYLDIVRPGTLRATGHILRLGKSVAFLEAELYSADQKLLAKGSSTVRIIDRPPPDLDST
jgi:acyl-CoA thioesterase